MDAQYTRSQILGMALVTTVLIGGVVEIAHAAVVSVSGTMVLETDPFPPESNSEIFVFNERQNIPFVSTQPLNFGSIAAGILVNSHYVQYDPISPTGAVGTGSVVFDGPILGVITSTAFLNADLDPEVSGTSDTYFGLETLLGPYPTGASPGSRGLGGADDITFTIGTNTLTVESLEIPRAGKGNLDAFRVLTAVPVPAAIWLLVTGLSVFIVVPRSKSLS